MSWLWNAYAWFEAHPWALLWLGATIGMGFEISRLRAYANSLNDRLNALAGRLRAAEDHR